MEMNEGPKEDIEKPTYSEGEKQPVTLGTNHPRGGKLLFEACLSYHVLGKQITRFRQEFPQLNRRALMVILGVYISEGDTLLYPFYNSDALDEFIERKPGGFYILKPNGWRVVWGCIYALRHAREKERGNMFLKDIDGRKFL